MSELKFETVEESVKFIKDQKSEYEAAIAAANQKIADLEKALDELKAANEKALNEVADLSGLLAAQEDASEEGSCIVTIDKKKYKLLGKNFIIPGKGSLSLKELQKDQAELKRMVKIKSGSLIPIEV